jgi:hypothetical protein
MPPVTPLLDTVSSPADLRGLSLAQLRQLADEVRAETGRAQPEQCIRGGLRHHRDIVNAGRAAVGPKPNPDRRAGVDRH